MRDQADNTYTAAKTPGPQDAPPGARQYDRRHGKKGEQGTLEEDGFELAVPPRKGKDTGEPLQASIAVWDMNL